MKTAVIAFTGRGAKLCKKICGKLPDSSGFAPERYAQGLTAFGTLHGWTGSAFSKFEQIIFISACGIAVRAIAPFVKNKTTDPAIIVLDEHARYAISLLSGHIGGANRLAEQIAKITGAAPVITTATDINGVFALDEWAAAHTVKILNPEAIKHISSALLNRETVGLAADFEIAGQLPNGLQNTRDAVCGVSVALQAKYPFQKTLCLVPAVVCLGIGCRKGAAEQDIEYAVKSVLEAHGIAMEAICCAASIDLKESEAGLLSFCKKYELGMEFFSAGELAEAGTGFHSSDYVKSITGVDNVCERAACLAACGGELAVRKTVERSVTVAAAVKHWRVDFGY